MPFVLESAGTTHVGEVRTRNEDRWAEDENLWVVADGMGGHRGGDVAAQTTVDTIIRYCNAKLEVDDVEGAEEELSEAVRLSNEAVLAKATSDKNLWGMGATVCILHAHDDNMVYAHVGDSRIYLLRGGELSQLTEDHSLLSQMLSSGQISEKEAERFIYKHVITRAVGTRRRVLADTAHISMLPSDLYLICTDGLTDGVSDEKIERIMNTTQGLESMADRLVEAALTAGGEDNVTVLLVQVRNGKSLSGQ